MKRNDFESLQIGDIVEVISRGSNYQKQGIVVQIDKARQESEYYWEGSVYILPINCIFKFRRCVIHGRIQNGLIRLYKHEIKLISKEMRSV